MSDFPAQLEAAKRASTVQLLFKAARLLNDEAIAAAAAHVDGPAVRASHTALLPHIDLDGTRTTVLAERVGISKQAVGQLVDDLVIHGMVERVPDPSDGRAKLVRFTPQGRSLLLHGLTVLDEVASHYADALGPGGLELLHGLLLRLVDAAQTARSRTAVP